METVSYIDMDGRAHPVQVEAWPVPVTVRMANAGRTPEGYHLPGDLATLPRPEAEPLLRSGLATRVVTS